MHINHLHSIVHNFRKHAVPDGEELGAAAVVAAGPSQGEVRRVGRHGTEFVRFKHQQGELVEVLSFMGTVYIVSFLSRSEGSWYPWSWRTRPMR